MEKSFRGRVTVAVWISAWEARSCPDREAVCRGKEKTASREFQFLFLQVGLKVADCAVSKSPCLFLHPRDEFAAFIWRHLFCSVIGLADS